MNVTVRTVELPPTVSFAISRATHTTKKVVLIDGGRLADLMIEHNLGVTTTKTYELKEVSNDFFDDGYIGDPTLATAERGKELFEGSVTAFCEALREISTFNFGR